MTPRKLHQDTHTDPHALMRRYGTELRLPELKFRIGVRSNLTERLGAKADEEAT